MKPQILIRKGNRFELNEKGLLPYLRRKKDMVTAAVSIVCKDFKDNQHKYEGLSAAQKLSRMNELIYRILEDWGIYKG
jgi:hypothetical protein